MSLIDLPTEDAILFREAFNSFDKNNDGLLSKKEFHDIFKKSGREFTSKQINFYFRSIEPKSTGFIDFNGFLRLLFLDEKCLSPITVAKNLFKEFDYDESGTIGIDEFGKMMRDIYALETGNVEFRIKQEFSRVDTDGSGQISIAEMAKILEAHMEEK